MSMETLTGVASEAMKGAAHAEKRARDHRAMSRYEALEMAEANVSLGTIVMLLAKISRQLEER